MKHLSFFLVILFCVISLGMRDSQFKFSRKATEPEEYINQKIKNVLGSDNLGVNGATADSVFYYEVPAGKVAVIGRLILYMSDGTAFDEGKFGGITGPLTNGLLIEAAGVTLDNWTENEDINEAMYDCESAGVIFGKETQVLHGRWTFGKAHSDFGGIRLEAGERFQATVRDDLSGLVHFGLTIQGQVFDQ